MSEPYAPIESYGLIGNMRSAALVGADGSIDWLCLPHFDSPSIFAKILDHKRGGSFRLHTSPSEQTCRTSQHYWPDTNVLLTRLSTDEGQGEVLDFMPVRVAKHDRARPALVRMARVEHGRMRLAYDCAPAFNYARDEHDLSVDGECARFSSGDSGLVLTSTVVLTQQDHAVRGEFTLRGGDCAVFSLWHLDGSRQQSDREAVHCVSAEEADELLDDTLSYWKNWLSHCTYHGRWRELVHRSALALKLLTFEPTGAIVAAPTCSLPEHFGGSRNWDYRYTWLRDAAFTIYALLHIGFQEEAGAFMHWLEERSHELEPGRMLRPVYGIDGRHELPEEELGHLEGYCQSKPVRIGNGAWDQMQIDVIGELIDAAYLYNRDGVPIPHSLWVELRKLLNWVCRNWEMRDHGVWEVRGEERHFVYSKLMCWVALDRGVRLARSRGFPGEVNRWRRKRDAIYKSIMTHGWNEKVRAFTQHYETEALDAANLIIPLVFFTAPNDPLFLDTIKAMDKPLSEGGLISDFRVHRYDPEGTDDGFDEPEGAFNMCTFWLVEALTRAGYANDECLERARMIFERAIEQASPHGLFAEQTSIKGTAAGNYPQGLTHLSAIISTYHLDKALSRDKRMGGQSSGVQEKE